jgi:hypothetical protein
MHHDQIMESYTQLIPLNNYPSNCVIKLRIKLQNHRPNPQKATYSIMVDDVKIRYMIDDDSSLTS